LPDAGEEEDVAALVERLVALAPTLVVLGYWTAVPSNGLGWS
jgi:hypothetical protein